MTPRKKSEEAEDATATVQDWPEEVQQLVDEDPVQAGIQTSEESETSSEESFGEAAGANAGEDDTNSAGLTTSEQREEDLVHKRNQTEGGAFGTPDVQALIEGSKADHSGKTALEVERGSEPDKAVSLSNAVMLAAMSEPRNAPASPEKVPTTAARTEKKDGWEYARVTDAGVEQMSRAELRALAEQRGYDTERMIGTRGSRRRFLEAQEQDLTFKQ